MDDLWSFGSVIALWIGVSVGLWWLHRRSVHGKQHSQMQQAARAVVLIGEAQKVYDAIRNSAAPPDVASDAERTAATHAVLKAIQEHGAFFDKVNVLRVKMLAAFGMEDYLPLSEILQIRRDLWAASEILLVEDPASFGEAFAEEGAYERFCAEAAALLFKVPSAASEDEDLIDLRLWLARSEAETFTKELKETIREARERDRLPTASEIAAYPVDAARRLPGYLRTAWAFLTEFYRYAVEVAASIRQSETMARGVGELRRAREELPQRLVTGFERASAAARQSATGLRRHYDFLVTAHDFQSKYEDVLRRAPELSERGRQFIARLELADRSERLRLTSANLLIWLTRQLATGLAHLIAGLQRLHALLGGTPPVALAAALIAPVPLRGRERPAFRSYQMALAMSGLQEERSQAAMTIAAEPKRVSKGNKAGVKAAKADKPKQPAKRKANGKQAAASPATAAPAAKAKTAKADRAVSPPPTQKPAKPAERAAAAEISAQAKAASPKKPEPIAPTPQPAASEPLPPVKPVASQREAEATLASPPRSASAKAKKSKTKTETRPQPTKHTAQPAQQNGTPSPAKAELPEAAAIQMKQQPVPPVVPNVPEAQAVRQGPVAPPTAEEPAKRHAKAEAVEIPTTEPVPPAPSAPEPVRSEAPAPIVEAEEQQGIPDAANGRQPPSARPKRPSFLSRLFGKAPAEPAEPDIAELIAAAWEREHAASPSLEAAAPIPSETTPTLLSKLSDIPAEDEPAEEIAEAENETRSEPVLEEDDDEASGEDPGPLTLSVMEVQSKLAPKSSQIRSFPWLRG